MPDLLKKAPKQLRLEYTEGVEVSRKFATAKVIKWGLLIYCFILFRSCFDSSMYQKQQQGNNRVVPSQTIEQVLPSRLEHYDASKLEFRKTFAWSGDEVYKDGIPLGLLGEAHVLTGQKGEVVGYLNNSGVYNSLGQRTGSLYKGDIFALDGKKIGGLKSKNQNLESIVDGDKKLANISSASHVIMTQEPKDHEYRIVGVIDNYKEDSKGKKDNLKEKGITISDS